MKKRSLAACVIALVGCRGIIGVQDLGLDAGADASAAKDAAGTDANGAADGGGLLDGSLLEDAAPDVFVSLCKGQTGGMCHACCRMSYGMQQQYLDLIAAGNGCICGGGMCTAECGTSICAGDAAMPPGTCAMCIDPLYLMPGQCKAAIDQCATQLDCELAGKCHQTCP